MLSPTSLSSLSDRHILMSEGDGKTENIISHYRLSTVQASRLAICI